MQSQSYFGRVLFLFSAINTCDRNYYTVFTRLFGKHMERFSVAVKHHICTRSKFLEVPV
jgi:hypothetical protein